MMRKAVTESPLDTLVDELMTLGLSKAAATLEEQYNSPDFLNCDRMTLLSRIIEPEYDSCINKRFSSRLRFAHLSGCPEDLSNCVDSKDRSYMPEDITSRLSSFDFVRNGMNVCILGASDSGKTYLAKSLGIMACNEFSVEYYETEALLESLADLKAMDFSKYSKRKKHLCKLDLLILDDFLLHSIADEQQVKILHELLNSRTESFKSTIVCSQRLPENWKAMILDDDIAADAIVKRATKHFTVMITSHKDS